MNKKIRADDDDDDEVCMTQSRRSHVMWSKERHVTS